MLDLAKSNPGNVRTRKTATPWRDRIVGEASIPPGDLVPNPQNWRTHPIEQGRALNVILDEVGWVQRVVVNKRTGFVVDGHERIELAIAKGAPTVPVVYVDLSPEEEAKVLATLDPIGAMASQDRDRVAALLASIETDNPDLDVLLKSIAESGGIEPPDFQPASADDQARLDVKTPVTCPECGHEFIA